MSRLNKLVKNIRKYGKEAPTPEATYCYLSDNGGRGLLICQRVGIAGNQNKQLRYKMVQLIWEGVPCLD